MSELNLVLSEKFDTVDAEAIRAELSEHLKVGDSGGARGWRGNYHRWPKYPG